MDNFIYLIRDKWSVETHSVGWSRYLLCRSTDSSIGYGWTFRSWKWLEKFPGIKLFYKTVGLWITANYFFFFFLKKFIRNRRKLIYIAINMTDVIEIELFCLRLEKSFRLMTPLFSFLIKSYRGCCRCVFYVACYFCRAWVHVYAHKRSQ